MRALGFVFLLLLSIFFWGQAQAHNLVQNIEVPFKSVDQSPPVIIYGHEDVGFFQAKSVLAKSKGKIEIQLIPPSYKREISFFDVRGSKRTLIFKKLFKAPAQHPEALSVQTRGQFSVPFFLTDLITNETDPPTFYPAIINRLGEIVWHDRSHFIPSRDLHSSTNISALPWKDGLIIRGAGKNSVWNIHTWKGLSTDPKPFILDGTALSAHHSFAVGTQELYTWVVMTKNIPASKDTIPVFAGLLGWFRAWGEEGRTIVGNRLVGLNPTTGAIRSIISSFDLTSPTDSPSRSLDDNMDRFLDAKTVADYRNLKKVNEPEAYIPERYDTDWSHENSIDVTPEGNLLVTSRNLNAVTLLTPEGKVLWSLGNEKFSTYKWSDSQIPLGLPHSARWIDANHIVVFDNAAPYRGMNLISSQSRVLWLKLLEDGKIEIEHELTLPGDKTLTKGSVRPLRSKGFLVWHPGPNTGVGQCLESDSQGNVVALLSIQWPWYKKHDEIVPIYEIGDTFVEAFATNSKTIHLESDYDKEVY
jgi:hypothetical protein